MINYVQIWNSNSCGKLISVALFCLYCSLLGGSCYIMKTYNRGRYWTFIYGSRSEETLLYIYIYIYIYIYTYTFFNIYIYIYIYIYCVISTYGCMCVCACVFVSYIHIHTRTYTYVLSQNKCANSILLKWRVYRLLLSKLMTVCNDWVIL